MKSTDERRNTTTSKIELNLSFGNTSCPAGDGICHSSVHPISKSASVASAVSRTFLNHLLLLWIVFTFFLIGCSLDETSMPQNHAAAKGETVKLICTSSEDGLWKYANYLAKDIEDNIHSGVKIMQTYEHIFTADKVSGQLGVSFKASDKTSGRYTCQPNGDTIHQISAQVIVLDPQPACSKEVVPGFVKASCSIGYRGYWPPTLEWRNIDGKLETNTTKNENIDVTSSLIVPFNETDPGPSYTLTCTPKFKIEDNPSPQKNSVSATNVPEFPASCTLVIGALEEAPSMETTSSHISSVSATVHYWPNLRLSLCLTTLVFLELLYKKLCP